MSDNRIHINRVTVGADGEVIDFDVESAAAHDAKIAARTQDAETPPGGTGDFIS